MNQDMEKELRQLDQRIQNLKKKLQKIGEMRPGTLTRQYRIPKEKKGPYYQISYTRKMKSRTEYVRPAFVKTLRKEIASYTQFKKIVLEWTDLALQQSQLKIKSAKNRLLKK